MASSSADSRQLLADLLDCPICMGFMSPPIYQCPNGHILCSNCKVKVKDSCTTCRRKMGVIRCLIIEKMADAIEFPCRYHDKGCPRSLKYESKLRHEHKECKHRPYSCTFPCTPSCAANGDIQTLLTHMSYVHKLQDAIPSHKILVMIALEPSRTIQILIRKDEWTKHQMHSSSTVVQVFRCFEEYFFLHICAFPSSRDEILQIYLTFMGETSDAERFRYRLEMVGKGNKTTCEGVPVSIREGKEKIHDATRGLALLTSSRRRKLGVRGEILRLQSR